MDAGLILGLTLAVLGLMVVVLGVIAAVVLGPAVRRALGERHDDVDAPSAAGEPDVDSAEGAEHGDGRRS